IEVKPGRQEFGAALAKAGSSPWAEAAAERRQEGAPGFYMAVELVVVFGSAPSCAPPTWARGVPREPGQVYARTLHHDRPALRDGLRGEDVMPRYLGCTWFQRGRSGPVGLERHPCRGAALL